jgi:hypothetical protein
VYFACLSGDLKRNWNNHRFLEISNEVVAHNFVTAGITDDNIVFVKGLFSKTMKPLSEIHNGCVLVKRQLLLVHVQLLICILVILLVFVEICWCVYKFYVVIFSCDSGV